MQNEDEGGAWSHLIEEPKSGLDAYSPDSMALDQGILASQREINSIQLLGDDGGVMCRVVPATPNGDCAFTSIRYAAILGNKLELAAELYRKSFIKLLISIFEDPNSEKIYKDMIDAIIENDKADDFATWKRLFARSGFYVYEAHLKLLSRYYNISFSLYYVDSDKAAFLPEVGNETIYHGEDLASAMIVRLAHVQSGNDSGLNHFDLIATNLDEGMEVKIKQIEKVTLKPGSNASHGIKEDLLPTLGHSRLSFKPKNETLYMCSKYSNGLDLIEYGSVPNELEQVTLEILNKLKIKKTKGKMVTFYVIKNGDETSFYLAISGNYSKNHSLLGSKIKKIKMPGTSITLVPPDLERKVIHDETDSEILNRYGLFSRFLLAATSDYEGNDPKRYPELAERFKLLGSPTEHIAKIKIFCKRREIIKECTAYNESSEAEPMVITEFIAKKIFYPKVIAPILQEDLCKYFPGLSIKTVDNKPLSVTEAVKMVASKSLTTVPVEAIDDIHLSMKTLWEHLDRFNNNEIAVKLSHCAEVNLLAYLAENINILEQPGQHYFFNLKIDDDFELRPLCDICHVDVRGRLEELFRRLGHDKGLTLTKAAIPVKVDDISVHNSSPVSGEEIACLCKLAMDSFARARSAIVKSDIKTAILLLQAADKSYRAALEAGSEQNADIEDGLKEIEDSIEAYKHPK